MAEIGLGKATIIKNLEIKWPYYTRPISIFKDVSINQTIKITEAGAIQKLDLPKLSFKKIKAEHKHH